MEVTMKKTLLLGAALAAGVLFGGHTAPVEAAPLVTALTTNPVQADVVEKAAWRCDGRRCSWVPGYYGPVPGYARSWAPPRFPHCYWKKGLLGRWKYKCND
jgi:hypothetical protein